MRVYGGCLFGHLFTSRCSGSNSGSSTRRTRTSSSSSSSSSGSSNLLLPLPPGKGKDRAYINTLTQKRRRSDRGLVMMLINH